MPTTDDAIPAVAKAPPRRRKDREKSGPRSNPLKRFTYGVALPAVLVYLAICALVLVSLHLMTSEINRIDDDRGKKAVVAAMESFIAQLAESAADEATWTEAYINTYVALNPAWMDSTWGSTARADGKYDVVLVTDSAGAILFGESNRGHLSGNVADHFGASGPLFATLEEAVSRIGNDATAAGFSAAGDGVSALAVAVIHGTSGQLTLSAEERRMLWIGKRVDTEMLQRTAHTFQIPVPRLAGGPVGDEQSYSLPDAAGAPVGLLVWLPLRPGDAAFRHAAGIASLFLLVVGALTFIVLAAFRSSVERRAESEARDWVNARYDQGTGLLNGFGLEESIARMIPRRRGETEIAVAYLEFEGLKDIAGSYGQETVELLFDKLADLIDVGIDGQALFARVGPDDFALCRAGEGASDMIGRFARIVLEIINEPIPLGALRLKVGASIGVAVATCNRTTVSEPVRMASAARQHARETGGNHLVEYEESLERDRERRLALQADIRRGLDADEFDVEYQPIFDFGSQTMRGVEALVRWPRRTGGPMSPGDFIPAAEASGVIEELGLFVLRRACRDMARYPEIKVSVNVSTVQFRSPTLAAQIDNILLATNFPAHRLQLEITESFLLAQPERATKAMEELRARGILIALDDFGSGYSSIGYLRQFQFDRLKLDRSLVEEIDLDPVKAALVESTMVFAFAMGLAVTAEGVERHEEARTLARLGCREFQGFLFSRPLRLDALGRLLHKQQTPLRQAG